MTEKSQGDAWVQKTPDLGAQMMSRELLGCVYRQDGHQQLQEVQPRLKRNVKLLQPKSQELSLTASDWPHFANLPAPEPATYSHETHGSPRAWVVRPPLEPGGWYPTLGHWRQAGHPPRVSRWPLVNEGDPRGAGTGRNVHR